MQGGIPVKLKRPRYFAPTNFIRGRRGFSILPAISNKEVKAGHGYKWLHSLSVKVVEKEEERKYACRNQSYCTFLIICTPKALFQLKNTTDGLFNKHAHK